MAKADARKHLGTSHGSAAKGDVANPDGMVLMHSEASTAYAPVKTPSSGALEAVDNPRGVESVGGQRLAVALWRTIDREFLQTLDGLREPSRLHSAENKIVCAP